MPTIITSCPHPTPYLPIAHPPAPPPALPPTWRRVTILSGATVIRLGRELTLRPAHTATHCAPICRYPGCALHYRASASWMRAQHHTALGGVTLDGNVVGQFMTLGGLDFYSTAAHCFILTGGTHTHTPHWRCYTPSLILFWALRAVCLQDGYTGCWYVASMADRAPSDHTFLVDDRLIAPAPPPHYPQHLPQLPGYDIVVHGHGQFSCQPVCSLHGVHTHPFATATREEAGGTGM